MKMAALPILVILSISGCTPSVEDKRDYVAMYVFNKDNKAPYFLLKVLNNDTFEAGLLGQEKNNDMSICKLDVNKSKSIWDLAHTVKSNILSGDYICEDTMKYSIQIQVNGNMSKYDLGNQGGKKSEELIDLLVKLSGLTRW